MDKIFWDNISSRGKDISACGLVGIMNRKRNAFSGELVRKALHIMNDRGNGLGAGFSAYGIYPDFKDFYALHVMYMRPHSRRETEDYLEKNLFIAEKGPIPTAEVRSISSAPLLYRYFVQPDRQRGDGELMEYSDDDFMVKIVMRINAEIDGAYVSSSGKNMGVFKGVGFPNEMADFYRIDEYEGYLWTGHTRFPTNTPGWWGGAHPFTLLDWSIIHNGEISSYGINKRYLEMFGYKLMLLTDTEVVAYMLDILIRRHRLPIEIACKVMTAPLWKEIDEMPERERDIYSALRQVYGSALLNGPFAFIFAHSQGMVGLNDRIKLRPLVAGTKDDYVYITSEEAALIEICSAPDDVWAPQGGEPVIFSVGDGYGNHRLLSGERGAQYHSYRGAVNP